MALKIKIYDSYGSVSRSDWHAVGENRSVFQQIEWYQSFPIPGSLRLLVAKKDDVIKAVLPFYIIANQEHYYHNPKKILCGDGERNVLFRKLPNENYFSQLRELNWFPAMITVSPYGYRGGLIFNEQTGEAEEIAKAVAKFTKKVCINEGVKLALFYYLNEDDDKIWIQSLGNIGAKTFIAGADCNLEVCWNSLEHYFKSLAKRGRKVRAEYKKSINSEEVTWKKIEYNGKSESNELFCSASLFKRNAQIHGDTNPPGYDEIIKNGLGKRLLLIGENPNFEIRSALLVLKKGNSFYPKFFGNTGVRNDYFFLTYNWLIKLAIKQNIQRIEYGGGSHKAKLLRGAILRLLKGTILVFDPNLEKLLSSFIPLYDMAKRSYFSEMVSKYQINV